MFFPTIQSGKRINTITCDNFGGLNRLSSIADNEFSEMKNCGNLRYPFIYPREKRNAIQSFDDEIKYVLPPIDSFNKGEPLFSGICGNKFYYRGKEESFSSQRIDRIPYPYNDASLYPDLVNDALARSFTKFGDVYYSYPDFTYFSPYGTPIEHSNWSHKFNIIGFLSNNNLSREGYATNILADDFKGKVGDRISISYETDVMHNNCTVDSEYPALKKTLIDEYDESNCAIVSAYITSIESTKDGYIQSIGLDLYDVMGKKTTFNNSDGSEKIPKSEVLYVSNLTISKYVPSLIYTCEFAGRVFGLDPYGKYIYASKLIEPLNFSEFDGLSDSSWYTEVGSGGEWTGICANGSYLYCFKKDIVYVLYGDNSKNFTIAKSFTPGCVSGESITIVNNYLYYMASDGIYCYNSGIPQKTSYKLGDCKYTSAVCKGFGSLLYACCRNDDGCELLVFDTDKNIWYRHDDIDIVGFFEYENKLYGATKHDFICFSGGLEDIECSVTSKLFTDATSFLRSIVSLYFRFKLSANADATIFVSYDGGEWIKCGFVSGGKICDTNISKSCTEMDDYTGDKHHDAGTVYSQRVPVRFRAASTYQYKIVCHGEVVIEAIERDVVLSGRYKR